LRRITFVTLDPRESLPSGPRPQTEPTLAEFVHLAEIDPIYFEASYYAAPDRGGEKPYAVLFITLKQTDYAAIGSPGMHGRE
jgi:DNA end-binding protein Ku